MALQHSPAAAGRFASTAADNLRAARAAWQRLTDHPTADRIALVADLVWRRGYPLGYVSAYAAVTGQVAAEAAWATVGQPDTEAASLRRLATAALAAADQLRADTLLAPPTDRDTLRAAEQAAAEPQHRDQPWTPVTARVWAASVRAGTIAGALSAATDIVIGWRTRSHAAAETGIHRLPAGPWAADLLATVTHATVTGTDAPPAATRLARREQTDSAVAVTPTGARPTPAHRRTRDEDPVNAARHPAPARLARPTPGRLSQHSGMTKEGH